MDERLHFLTFSYTFCYPPSVSDSSFFSKKNREFFGHNALSMIPKCGGGPETLSALWFAEPEVSLLKTYQAGSVMPLPSDRLANSFQTHHLVAQRYGRNTCSMVFVSTRTSWASTQSSPLRMRQLHERPGQDFQNRPTVGR